MGGKVGEIGRWGSSTPRGGVLLVVLLAACRPTSGSVVVSSAVQSSPAPTVTFEQGTFALLWMDAALYRRPHGEAVRLVELERAREQSPGLHWTVQVHERRGPWLRVGPVTRWLDGGESIHCIETGMFRSRGLDVSLWVREDDLVPVIGDTLTHSFEDGTGVTLLPGVPVIDGQPWADGYWLPIDPAGLTDVLYRPAAPIPPSDGRQVFEVNDPSPTLNGKPVRHTGNPHDYGTSHFVAMRGDLMEVSRCGQVHMRLVVPPEAQGAGVANVLGKLCDGPEPTATLPRGTTLYWHDGREAGAVLDDLVRTDIDPSTRERTCFTLQPNAAHGAAETEHGLHLCVDTSAIEFGLRCERGALHDVLAD